MPRIIQFTDCHLFAEPHRTLRDITTWPRFSSVLEAVHREVAQLDLLVFTGDTAHDESEATYVAVRNALGKFERRVRFVPGNHDDRAHLRSTFPQAGDGPTARVTFQERWPDWLVIGLDSQCPGELPGQLGSEQLDWLEACLSKTPIPTALFFHHPPIPVQSAWLDRIGLQDSAEFERLLIDNPHVRLVFCGHVHQAVTGSIGQATVFTTPAVGPQFRSRREQLEIDPGPPAYRIIDLYPGGRWSTQTVLSPLPI